MTINDHVTTFDGLPIVRFDREAELPADEDDGEVYRYTAVGE